MAESRDLTITEKSFEKKRKIKLDEDGIPYVSSP